MSRKKSVKKSSSNFKSNTEQVKKFLSRAKKKLSDQQISWSYEYGIIRLYREFEALMLEALIGAVTAVLS